MSMRRPRLVTARYPENNSVTGYDRRTNVSKNAVLGHVDKMRSLHFLPLSC